MRPVWPRAVLTVAWRGPGRALLPAALLGWVVLAWLVTTGPPAHVAGAVGHEHVAPLTLPTARVLSPPAAMWMAMVLAMAPPLLLREVGRLWRNNLRRRRAVATAAFLGGYLAIWMGVGVVLLTLAGSVKADSPRFVLVLVLVGVWLCSPARQRCLNACHRTATPRIFGVSALWDSLRYGVSTGGNCAAICGPVMLLALLVPDHHLLAMVVAALASTVERYRPARPPGWQLPVLQH